MSEPQWDGRRGDKQCPHGYTKRAACRECRDEDANKTENDLDAALAEIERLRAALEQRYSAHRLMSFHSLKMKRVHCDECDAFREALGEPNP